jgi:hypothetical protein
MTKLSDTQHTILTTAGQRDDRNVLPLPASLRGGAATKVVGAMLAKGLIEEVDADTQKGEPFWRETGNGHGVTLIATDAGLAAIGIEMVSGDPAPKARMPRKGTKQALLIEMLRAEGGATIEEITATTGWAAHTCRGAMSGALKKRFGLTITSEKVEGRGRVYKLSRT